MKKQSFLRTTVVLIIAILVLGMAPQTASALTNKNVRTWYWSNNTNIQSVAIGDVDGDGQVETVTGGFYNDGTHDVAQLCVWSGSTLTLKNVKTWYWNDGGGINSVSIGDVDNDGKVEIVTGGYYLDGSRSVAQLCVWSGSTLTLKNVKTWYWGSYTYVARVVIGDVDGDGQVEIVTAGSYNDGTRDVAQLCVWSGSTLTLENVRTWYWVTTTYILAVAVGDVDGDGQVEIVTGGYFDGTRDVAQLCVWSGSTLTLENVKTWYWNSNTFIRSISIGDVDGDSQVEIVTGGDYVDVSRSVAQLCVWSGSTLTLENVKTWYSVSFTFIHSVVVGDVDGDRQAEIVTGGTYTDGTRLVAQLCVWSGSTLALESNGNWYWSRNTYINSVAEGNVEGDGQTEIVTGGIYNDGTRDVAQLCVWGS